jgi:hypothetical protein
MPQKIAPGLPELFAITDYFSASRTLVAPAWDGPFFGCLISPAFIS